MFRFNVLAAVLLVVGQSAFAYTREARPDEVRAFCEAIDKEQAAEQADQAIDLDSCLKSAMVIQFKIGALTISGEVKIKFPGHDQTQTCDAAIDNTGKINRNTIACQ